MLLLDEVSVSRFGVFGGRISGIMISVMVTARITNKVISKILYITLIGNEIVFFNKPPAVLAMHIRFN